MNESVQIGQERVLRIALKGIFNEPGQGVNGHAAALGPVCFVFAYHVHLSSTRKDSQS
jgi:hypothetical protein